ADAVRLVARRHHGGDPRPCRELRCLPIVALAAAPKGAAGEQQVEPDRKRNRSDGYHASKASALPLAWPRSRKAPPTGPVKTIQHIQGIGLGKVGRAGRPC